MSMTPSGPRETGDDALGMHEGICRRDFLNAVALATGGVFLSPRELLAASDDWTGYGGVGDYRFANGNTKGSAFFPVPHAGGFVAQSYDMIGVDRHRFEYQKWTGTAPEIPLSQTTYDMLGRQGPTYGFYFGARFGQRPGLWLIDPWGKQLQGAPISEATRAELLRVRNGPERMPETEWRPAFEDDPISRRLDTITLEQHLMDKHGLSRDTIRTFLSPVTGGGYGLGPDVLSGYCAYAPETQHPKDGDEEAGGQMFPGGNAGFARHIVKTLIPASIDGPRTLEGVCRGRVNLRALDRPGQRTRIRQGSTVVWVAHDGEPEKSRFVIVAYTRRARVHRLKARAVVLAGGNWTTKHIVRDLPAEHREAYAGFYRSPCLMANVAVRNWRFLYDMGISGGGSRGSATTSRCASSRPSARNHPPSTPTHRSC
jgi:spermidine dehydrogenase